MKTNSGLVIYLHSKAVLLKSSSVIVGSNANQAYKYTKKKRIFNVAMNVNKNFSIYFMLWFKRNHPNIFTENFLFIYN